MPGVLAVLCCLAAVLIQSAVFAADCSKMPTKLAVAFCASDDLSELDGAMSKRLADLYGPMLGDNQRAYAALAADQLRWREELAFSCPTLATDCLLPKAKARLALLEERGADYATELYDSKGIEIGDARLRYEGAKGATLDDKEFADIVSRLDMEVRYIDPSVDALAFAVNHGGNGIHCEPYEYFLIAVRRTRPPEIINVSKEVIGPGDRDGCMSIRRVGDGIEFKKPARPWTDGRLYKWTPTGGLVDVAISPWMPQPGTTLKGLPLNAYPTNKLENEQFYNALRAATNTGNVAFGEAAEAFSWSWSDPFEADGFVAMNSCPFPGRGDRCFGKFKPHAVYDRVTDKLYFAFPPRDITPGCLSDLPEETQRAVKYVPPRQRWPEGAFLALEESFCRTL